MGARIPQVRNVSFSQMPVVAEEDEPEEKKETRDVRGGQRDHTCWAPGSPDLHRLQQCDCITFVSN